MYIDRLKVKNFRTYEDLSLDFNPGVVIFVGPNGVGKTNIVEAISYIGNLSSHRVNFDGPLIKNNHSHAQIATRPIRGNLQLNIELDIQSPGKNLARINRGLSSSPQEIHGIVKTVTFGPEDLSLVRGEPHDRRQFLDTLISLKHPAFSQYKSEFDKVLKQKNSLLKQNYKYEENFSQTLDIFNEKFAYSAAVITFYRLEMLKEINYYIPDIYAQLSSSDKKIQVRYEGAVDKYLSEKLSENIRLNSEEKNGKKTTHTVVSHDLKVDIIENIQKIYRETLDKIKDQEQERRLSLVGPQRDDLFLLLGENVAKGYASHGEGWSYALALKLASYYILQDQKLENKDQPIIILDDVFAELDARRRTQLSHLIEDVEQVFITAAVWEDIPKQFRSPGIQVFDVTPGQVIPRKI